MNMNSTVEDYGTLNLHVLKQIEKMVNASIKQYINTYVKQLLKSSY